jgi:hypothetical protein
MRRVPRADDQCQRQQRHKDEQGCRRGDDDNDRGIALVSSQEVVVQVHHKLSCARLGAADRGELAGVLAVLECAFESSIAGPGAGNHKADPSRHERLGDLGAAASQVLHRAAVEPIGMAKGVLGLPAAAIFELVRYEPQHVDELRGQSDLPITVWS